MSYAVGLILGDSMLYGFTEIQIGGSSSGGVYVTYSINADGNVLGGSFSERWIKDPSHAGDYECQTFIVSGALTSNPAPAWSNMGVGHTWGLTVNPGAYGDCHFRVDVRKVGTTQVLRSAIVRLYGSGLDGTPGAPPPSPVVGGGGGGLRSPTGRQVSF